MNNKIENNPNIFGCQKEKLLILFALWTVFIIYFILDENTAGIIQSWQSLLTTRNMRTLGLLLIFALVVIFDIFLLLSYIANRRSFIELTDTHLIVKKPVCYPFFKMEILNIPYAEIKSVEEDLPFFICNMLTGKTLGYCIIINKNEGYSQDEKIKFFGLSDGRMFFREIGDKIVKNTSEDLNKAELDEEKNNEKWNEENYLKEMFVAKPYDYKIYKRKTRKFDRTILIILAVIIVITIVGAPLGVIVISIIVGDARKCKSYIEFTQSGIVINDYKGGLFGKHTYIEIPYYEVSEVKCFSYNEGNAYFNFNIYLKNSEEIKTFTIDQNIIDVHEDLLEYILADKNVKLSINFKG